ncbi:histidine kinase [Luteolibacter flavescens]|uniref:Histidine kinase n=1 Tax=Luteolibacter flavescens TaxID=1859460 RepID=A0ABT3FWC4_9BACT|nr:histidine kinase [Luteolibacter flavescens]MCW1887858.1 histidine kinase [Luteolibacter flavescens]
MSPNEGAGQDAAAMGGSSASGNTGSGAGGTGWMERRAYWRFQLFAWGFLGGYLLIVNLFFAKWKPIMVEVGKIALFMIASHAIARLARSKDWFRLERSGLFARGLPACLAGGLVITAICHPLTKDWSGKPLGVQAHWFMMDYVRNAAILMMWGSFFVTFCFREISHRAEIDRVRLLASSKEMQLSTLRNQLNPHFLFNSFNLLRSLVQKDPNAARDAITHLAEMMRHSLSTVSRNTIPLARELEFVESYVALERLRHEERLRISADVPGELLSRRIPSMLLYTLVENAVKYGLDQSRTGADVCYRVWLESGRLWLRVINGGSLGGSGTGAVASAGTGLANVRQRLELLYGNEASVEIFELDQQVVAQAHWPAVEHGEGEIGVNVRPNVEAGV